MNKINYQKVLDEKLNKLSGEKPPKLLLHVCCAPCSSYVLEYLSEYFEITAFFYNPNIDTDSEYRHRAEELIRFINEKKFSNKVDYVIAEYNSTEFYDTVKGLEQCREGGKRCFKCYELRLRRSADYAKKHKYDYFTTTLSISPLKNADKLNEIGGNLSGEYKILYLFSDFKRKMAINVQLNCQRNIIFIGKTFVDVFFQKIKTTINCLQYK